MSSLISGYEYDIFISYRQKDNKHDGWVTEFVYNLIGELESAFKEDIGLYFDSNHNDGLLETYDVDASLKDKLNCIVFIPIISRTYCDPKSFAWEHEFKSFIEKASHDQFGLKVKLQNGNVASRVLPIRIHDLDNDDIELCESVLGGSIRSVDFIYKSAGVNRPLRSLEEKPNDNLNSTLYRDQINKVANSIKEIISALGQNTQRKPVVPKEVFKPILLPKERKKTKIIFGLVLALALIVFGYISIPTLSKPKEQLEKSVAILPFRNDTGNDSTTYFLNGVMEEILNNLQKISDFGRVLSRNSVEQFRNNNIKSTPEIAKKLNVNYVIEGSGQKYGTKFVLRVQLIIANNEKHLWGKSYNREIKETSDIISIQSEIAQSIAAELKAIITPEEKKIIEKIPTTNLSAYNFYQQGREEHTKYWNDNHNRTALQNAEDLYHKSLKYDSAFAQAYSGLARVYWDKHFLKGKEYFSENFMDSVLILTKIALSLDNHLSEPYTLRGKYYSEIGKQEEAIEEFDKAIKLNPNDWMAYYEKGQFYWNTDIVITINNTQRAASINRGRELPALLGDLGYAYFTAGITEKAKQFFQDRLKLDGDSLSYYFALENSEFWLTNFNKSIEYGKKCFKIDSTNTDILYSLGMSYGWLGQYKESFGYFKKFHERLKMAGKLDINLHRIGYAFWQNGYKKEAEHYFNEQIKYCKRAINLKRTYGERLWTYYDLASIFAFKGEKNKAYKNLRIFDEIKKVPLWMSMLMKTDPLFSSIRNEPEFKTIANDIEEKYRSEHERVGKWMKEQGIQ